METSGKIGGYTEFAAIYMTSQDPGLHPFFSCTPQLSDRVRGVLNEGGLLASARDGIYPGSIRVIGWHGTSRPACPTVLQASGSS